MKCSLFKTIEKRKRTMMTPRVAAIHDMSGFGRCSLTVAIPILSAMGVQCCPLPTAFLSTHTGGFEGFTFLDMTDEMSKVADHWASLGLTFQAVYSGFLGSERQIGVVENFICRFRGPDTVVVVDPVMGDYGRVYQTYTAAMCSGMARLAELADVITPNLTEAALLLGQPYEMLPAGEAGLREITERLSLGGRRSVVLTGASLAGPAPSASTPAPGRRRPFRPPMWPMSSTAPGTCSPASSPGPWCGGSPSPPPPERRRRSSVPARSGPRRKTCLCGRAWILNPCWVC